MSYEYEGLAALKRSGLGEETTQRFIIDAGAVYAFKDVDEIDASKLSKGIPMDPDVWDEARIGATSGGNTFEVEQEFREIEIDGITGQVKGAKRKIMVVPTLTANIIEMSTENFQMAFPGADVEDWPDVGDIDGEDEVSHDLITRTCDIELADYVDLVALVGTLSGFSHCKDNDLIGEPVIFMVKNGLSDQTITIETNDEDEVVFELQFTGHYDWEDLITEPWKILFPKRITESYHVTFEVSESGNGTDIEGAEVELEGVATKETDENGEAKFLYVPVGEYDYTVTAEGYDTVEGAVEVVDEDITETVEMDTEA